VAARLGGAVALGQLMLLRDIAHDDGVALLVGQAHRRHPDFDRKGCAIQAHAAAFLGRGVGAVPGLEQQGRIVAQQGGGAAPCQPAGVGTEHVFRCRVAGNNRAGIVEHQHAVRNMLQQAAQPAIALALARMGTAQLARSDFIGDHGRQVAQQRALFRVEHARNPVEDAEGTDAAAVRRAQRMAGVEARAEFGHEGIAGEARVAHRVFDHHQTLLQDGVGTEGVGAGALPEGQADAGLEPLALGVDQADQCDRHAEQARRHAGDAVESFFGGGIEDVQVAQGLQPMRFLLKQGRCQHINSIIGAFATSAYDPPWHRMVRYVDDAGGCVVE